MIQIRRSNERGHAQHGWLDSHHSFSFAHYYDPDHMGFGALRVINEDRVGPGGAFGEHPHENMEILSLVLSGSLAHRDSMGNSSVLSSGDVQRMTAGSGIRHSEGNPSLVDPVHFLQIWIIPERQGLEPSYEERHFSREDKAGRLLLLASGNPAASGSLTNGALKIHQDVDLYGTSLATGEEVWHTLAPGRRAWVQVIEGQLKLGEQIFNQGDAAVVTHEEEVHLLAEKPSEAILFDLA